MTFRSMIRSRAALVCAIILAQFVVFEAALRLKGGSEAAPAFQKLFVTDARIGYRLAPGVSTQFKTSEFDTAISINSSGVRDREIGDRPPDERRIVVLGDSLVMAVQVPLEQTFTARLEQALGAKTTPPPRYRVINAGVQGYGPVEEYLFHRHVTSRLSPDIVVMALYVANDAVEALVSAGRLEDAAAGGARAAAPARPASALETLNQWRRRVIRRSMVLQVARLRFTTLLDRFGGTQEIDPPLRSYLHDAPPEITRGLAVVRDTVARMKTLTDAQGARLVVLLLPARFQVDDADFGRLSAFVARSGLTLERDRATTRFRETLDGLGVPVFDVLPVLRSAAAPTTLYFESTAHFTAYGHQVLADALEGFLERQGLVAGERR